MKQKKYIPIEVVAYILEEDINWVKQKIDSKEFFFGYKNEKDEYIINAKSFESYLLSSAPDLLKVFHNKGEKNG